MIDEILTFWFGDLDDHGRADAEHAKRWWQKDAAFDARVRDQFLNEHRAVSSGERETWLEQPRGRLASIILLDQFSRNMFRDTPKMFASDGQARAIASNGIDRGIDRQLRTDERTFFYMPLMHSESLADQDRSVELWTRFEEEVPGEFRERISTNLNYAIQHRDIVVKFGRFPHRNAILNRPSTDVERDFLAGPGSSF